MTQLLTERERECVELLGSWEVETPLPSNHPRCDQLLSFQSNTIPFTSYGSACY